MRRVIALLVLAVLSLGLLVLTGCPKKQVKDTDTTAGDTVENPDPRPKPQ